MKFGELINYLENSHRSDLVEWCLLNPNENIYKITCASPPKRKNGTLQIAIPADWAESMIGNTELPERVYIVMFKKGATKAYKESNICPLCGKDSFNSEVHKECSDREKYLADK